VVFLAVGFEEVYSNKKHAAATGTAGTAATVTAGTAATGTAGTATTGALSATFTFPSLLAASCPFAVMLHPMS
jgi:hypothetical protein